MNTTMKLPSLLLPLSLCISCCALLAACASVGPDYKGAPAVAEDAVNAKSFARDGAGTTHSEPVAEWWRSLDDARLSELIEAALQHSPTLAATEARLRQSRARFAQQKTQQLPKATASAAMLDLDRPGADPQWTRLYATGIDATWEIDIFGGTRRAVEAAAADAQAAEADLADAQVSLAAEVANDYAELRAQQQRRLLATQATDDDRRMLALVQQQRAQGVASQMDVEKLIAQTRGDEANLEDIDAAIAIALDQLAVLTGKSPGALDVTLAAPQTLPHVPAQVAIGDPAALIRHRPDVRAAERRLASSQAQIGQKVAGYFPKLNLFGNIGFAGTTTNNLFSHDNLAYLGVPYLTWNVFDFGSTSSAVHQAEGARDEARAKYESAVLGALQDANASLARYGHQRERTVKLLAQTESAARTADLTQQRRDRGVANLIDVLDAQRSLSEARMSSLAAEADLLKDFVALHKSLGLGWRPVDDQ